jgi:hypothetical protein
VLVETGGGGTQVYSLTFLISVRTFVACRYFNKVRGSFCVLSRAKIMERSLEQRYVIQFCEKLGKSGSETSQLLRTAYGDAVLPSAPSLQVAQGVLGLKGES